VIPGWPMKAAELSELSGRTLLVVEDDDDVVDMLATLLGRYGVHLVRARTVADAVAYADTAPGRVAPSYSAPSRHLFMKTADAPLRQWGRRLIGR
jgi:CheY-like chemotaxis protein